MDDQMLDVLTNIQLLCEDCIYGTHYTKEFYIPQRTEKALNEICSVIIEKNFMKNNDFKAKIYISYFEEFLKTLYDSSDERIDKNLIKMYYREIFGKEIYES